MAGGHAENFKGEADGTLWKTTDHNEASVLEMLSKNPLSKNCVPKIYDIQEGVAGPVTARQEGVTTKAEDTGVRVRMENLTKDFQKPCIMDVKFGVRSYEQAGYPSKPGKRDRLAQRDAATTTLKMGMRLSGMTVVRSDGSVHQREAHEFGRTLDPEGFIDEITDFFCEGPERLSAPRRTDAAAAQSQMAQIEKFFAVQTKLSFVGSSILFVREGDAAAIRSGAAPPVVRMIDFAHTIPPEGGPCVDIGYHYGAQNMVAILGAIAKNKVPELKSSLDKFFVMSNSEIRTAKGRDDLYNVGYDSRESVSKHYNFGTKEYHSLTKWLIENDKEATL